LLNLDTLAEVTETNGPEALARAHRDWIEETLSAERGQREEMWTKSLAVGSELFVQKVQENLGVRGMGRGVGVTGDAYVLRESPATYGGNFDPENRAIAPNNSFFRDVFS
jgi:putative transposase